jgi:hypothetical protein
MARRGHPSTAHEYRADGSCIHCGMYRVNVEAMSHVCTPEREAEQDAKEKAEQDDKE